MAGIVALSKFFFDWDKGLGHLLLLIPLSLHSAIFPNNRPSHGVRQLKKILKEYRRSISAVDLCNGSLYDCVYSLEYSLRHGIYGADHLHTATCVQRPI